eukprot:3764920-Rhodomonas_salina.1
MFRGRNGRPGEPSSSGRRPMRRLEAAAPLSVSHSHSQCTGMMLPRMAAKRLATCRVGLRPKMSEHEPPMKQPTPSPARIAVSTHATRKSEQAKSWCSVSPR